MNSADFLFMGEHLTALPSGALFWAAKQTLIVADLHLGKAERIARRGGGMLPPYEITETLTKLTFDIDATKPDTMLCLGDSFDDIAATKALDDTHRQTLFRLQAGRRWLWLEGNHDPGPIDLGGEHLAEYLSAPLTFRHIADPETKPGEVSGHFHPKARIKGTSRPCFMVDDNRLVLPAYGCYTGGLSWVDPGLRKLFRPRAMAYLTGRKILSVPVPMG